MLNQTHNRRLSRSLTEEKRHYKLFKSGKLWLAAGISLTLLGAIGISTTTPVHAATALATTQVLASIQNRSAATMPTGGYTVILSAGLHAPTWSAADFVVSATGSNTYSVTLSQAGLSALQAANPAVDVTAATVKAGTLTLAQTATNNTRQVSATTQQATASNATVASQPTKASEAPNQDQSASTGAVPTNQQPATTKLGDADDAAVAQAKVRAQTAYATTGQPQVLTRTAAPATESAKVSLSSTAVGYGSGQQSLTITYTMTNATAGDDFTITVPAPNAVLTWSDTDVAKLAPAIGTTTITPNSDGSHTITNHFTTSVAGDTIQEISIGLNDNYPAQSKPIDSVGTQTNTVSFAVNGVDQPKLTFTTTVTPTATPSDVTRANPNAKAVSAVNPNTEYVYDFAVNEANGVRDNTTTSGPVNSAVNYGTTITIPVPTGFTLDEALTKTINNFDDETTITQPTGASGDIIITVPKGSGNQGYQSRPPYKLAGSFVDPTTTANQTLTAAGVATVVQQVDETGTTLTFKSKNPWQETLLGTASTADLKLEVAAHGNSLQNGDKLILDDDPTNDPTDLASYSFKYQAPAATSDATITLAIPDGFDAHGIIVPTSDTNTNVYMAGTTSYSYTLTLADGAKETGTVAPGGTINSQASSPIRQAVLTPNLLASGAESGTFKLLGTLSAKYDSGAAVKNGDQLTTSISIAVPDHDAIISKYTETVATPTGALHLYYEQNSKTPGEDGGLFSIYGNNPGFGQTTNLVFEPILYYVLPSAVSVASVSGTQDAKVTQQLLPDGQVVVKIDYTGTGESIDVGIDTWSNNIVRVTNNSDALPGTYPWTSYVTSSTTPLSETTKVTDPTQTLGDTAAVALSEGSGNWVIEQAATIMSASLAQGDEVVPVTSATLDKNSSNSLQFDVNVINTTSNVSNGTLVVNLPVKDDDQGSGYTLNLTGPIVLPTQFTTGDGSQVPLVATVLYKTSRADIVAGSSSADLDGFVPASAVNDWGEVRAVAIQFTNLPADTSTGRMVLTGTVANQVTLGGQTGYLQTRFYLPGANVSIADKTSGAARLTITGTETIPAQFHYVDAEGQDQIIALSDLTKTVNDNTDTLSNDYPTTQTALSSVDQALIPSGYQLRPNSLHLLDAAGHTVDAFGETVTTTMTGDVAQYELDAVAKLAVTYVDDANAGATVTVPSTTSTTISGVAGATGTYTVVVPAGYELAKNQAGTVSYTLKAGNNALTIHLVHATQATTVTTTRTIRYTLPANATVTTPVTVVQPVTWHVVTDVITGHSVATPTQNYAEVASPTLTGYTPNLATVSQSLLTPTTEPLVNTTVTVNYTADPVNLDVTYLDDVTGAKIVASGTTISGHTGEQGTYSVSVPAGYVLASKQAASVAYTLSPATSGLTIHLTHHVTHSQLTTTQTINYLVAGSATAPSAKTQQLTWQVATDDVAHTSVYTPQGQYATIDSPIVAGYTPDQESISLREAPVTSTPTNTIQTVTYTPNQQSATVTIATTNGRVLKQLTLNGKSDTLMPTGEVTDCLNSLLKAGYTILTDPFVDDVFDHDDATNQPFTIVMKAPTISALPVTMGSTKSAVLTKQSRRTLSSVKVAGETQRTERNSKQLPQTGEASNWLAMLGLGLLGLVGLTERRRHE